MPSNDDNVNQTNLIVIDTMTSAALPKVAFNKPPSICLHMLPSRDFPVKKPEVARWTRRRSARLLSSDEGKMTTKRNRRATDLIMPSSQPSNLRLELLLEELFCRY